MANTTKIITDEGADLAETVHRAGSYAVTYRNGELGFGVTHIPTGMRLARAYIRHRAISACEEAARVMPPALDACEFGEDPRLRLTFDELVRCKEGARSVRAMCGPGAL